VGKDRRNAMKSMMVAAAVAAAFLAGETRAFGQ
jgi:hypothetical protein